MSSITSFTAVDHQPDFTYVDTPEALSQFLDLLDTLPLSYPSPSLYIDLEGVNLSRHGSISIIQAMISSTQQVYLIDVHVLGKVSFLATNQNGKSFRDFLSSETISKAFFDVRADSNALYYHYQVELRGVQDIQLMEVATRCSGRSRKCVNGLAKCMEYSSGLSAAERSACKRVKEAGIRLFAPEHGGNYEVFNARPLDPVLIGYCVQDVRLLPKLWKDYDNKLSSRLRQRILDLSHDRIAESQSSSFVTQGRHLALAPLI